MTNPSRSKVKSTLAAAFSALLAMTALSSAQSTIATLSGLAPSAGTLNPALASGTTDYTASVAYATTDITVTPTATDPAATITVNSVPITSGSPSGAISLNPTDEGAGVGIDLVQVKIRRTLAVGGKLFARLNVQNTP